MLRHRDMETERTRWDTRAVSRSNPITAARINTKYFNNIFLITHKSLPFLLLVVTGYPGLLIAGVVIVVKFENIS